MSRNAAILNLKVDTTELRPSQVRLLKRLMSTILYNLTCQNESDYFESSEQLLKICSSLIKESNFSKTFGHGGLGLSECTTQALEFAIDQLRDQIADTSFIELDN